MSDTKKILLVDDDPDFVQSNRDLLEACGYDVVSAHDGTSGIELAKKEQPDLMILDVMMTTDTEGFEVARKIPETPELRGLPVLLVTGVAKALHLPSHLEPDSTWLPVDRVLEKPIDPARLLAEVERILS